MVNKIINLIKYLKSNTMKAIAKNHCKIMMHKYDNMQRTTYQYLNKGDVISGEIFSDDEIKSSEFSCVLGDRIITFINKGYLIPTFESQFEYVKK
jgi:exosome complex RNA-binding protein Rrp4